MTIQAAKTNPPTHESAVQLSHADNMQLLELLVDLDVPPESRLWSNLGPAEEAVIVEILEVRTSAIIASGTLIFEKSNN